MENEPDLIRDQMQETRTALTDKLDTLQQKMADTVESITTPVTETAQTVKDAVSDSVSTVKESVSEAAESIKETLNLRRQVEEHPWTMVLGGVAVGYVVGRLLPSSPIETARSLVSGTDSVASGMSQPVRGHNGHQAAASSSGGGLFGHLSQALQGEMGKLTNLGISVGLGLVRDLVTQSLQGEVGDRVRQIVDDFTHKVGGEPLNEPIVAPPSEEPRSTQVQGAGPHSARPRW